MSDELHKDEDTEVEAHMPRQGSPRQGSPRQGANIEPTDETGDEFEAHMRYGSPRQGSPRQG